MASGHQIAMSLRIAYLTLHRRTQAQLARSGVTADQFVLLSVLAQGDGITQQELSRRASSDPNTIRSMLVLLERGGLVTREPHPNDSRAHSVKLTLVGRQIEERIAASLKPLQDRLLCTFDGEDGDVLVGLLARIPAALARPHHRKGRIPTVGVSGIDA